MWREYSALKSMGPLCLTHDWGNRSMNQWKWRHHPCRHYMLLKNLLAQKVCLCLDSLTGRINLQYLRQKQRCCATVVWLSDMWRPGLCRCHIHFVSHSLHAHRRSHPDPAAQRCVCVGHPSKTLDLLSRHNPYMPVLTCALTRESKLRHSREQQSTGMEMTCPLLLKIRHASAKEMTCRRKMNRQIVM